MTKSNPTPECRWFQFRLRTLLIVVVLLSLPLGWLAWKMRQAERQRQAVEAIREAGGAVQYDYEYVQPEPPVPSWLRELVGVDMFANVNCVNFIGSEVSDAALEHLKGITSLEYLNLRDTQVTGAGLEHLKGMTSLQTLYLSGTHVTEEGIDELKKAIPNCRIAWDGT